MIGTFSIVSSITVDPQFWATNLMPSGILEAWLQPDGSMVEAGDAVAMVRIEGSRHALQAPARGRLLASTKANTMIQPGMTIGSITRHLDRMVTDAPASIEGRPESRDDSTHLA